MFECQAACQKINDVIRKKDNIHENQNKEENETKNRKAENPCTYTHWSQWSSCSCTGKRARHKLLVTSDSSSRPKIEKETYDTRKTENRKKKHGGVEENETWWEEGANVDGRGETCLKSRCKRKVVERQRCRVPTKCMYPCVFICFHCWICIHLFVVFIFRVIVLYKIIISIIIFITITFVRFSFINELN